MQLLVTTNQLTDVQRDIESFSREVMQGKAVLKSLKGQETSVSKQCVLPNELNDAVCLCEVT